MINAEILGEVYDLSDLRQQITNAEEDMLIRINSEGGSVFEGLQTVNCIANSEHRISAKVECMAASIAAVICLACDDFTITKNDLLVVHNCWTVAVGNKEELAQEVEAMKAIDTILHNVIGEHCKDAETLLARMDEGDVYLTGEEVAELFDNCTLVDKPVKEGRQNYVEFGAYVASRREIEAGLKAEIEELKALLDEATKPQPKEEKPMYIITDEVKAILAEEL